MGRPLCFKPLGAVTPGAPVNLLPGGITAGRPHKLPVSELAEPLLSTSRRTFHPAPGQFHDKRFRETPIPS